MTLGSGEPETLLRWRFRSYLLLGAGAVLLVAAVALRTPVPVFLALPFLLAAPAAAFSGPRTTPRLTGRWGAEGSGPEVTIRGSVHPPDGLDPHNLRFDGPCPPGLREVAPAALEVRSDRLEFRLTWQALEPTIEVVAPPRIAWQDPAGLVERRAFVELPDLVVERYPPELLRLAGVRLRRTMVLPGETLSRHIGPAGEFYGIREATPADPARRINWSASARAGRLLTNDYQVDRTGDVLLVLDTRATSLGPAVDERLLAISRAAAAGIAESFLRAKSRVGLGVFGEFLSAVPLSSGRAQRGRIRAALLAARIDPASAPSERCAIALRRYFPPDVTTVVFSTLVDEASADLLPHLRLRGFPVVALSPSPLPVYPHVPPLSPEDEQLIGRLQQLLRRDQVARAWEEAPTVDWADYWSLAPFVNLLSRPATRRVG